MASFEEVRADLLQANQKVSESMGALQQAGNQLEAAQSHLQRVSVGSSQTDTSDANAQLARAISSLTEVQQMVSHTTSTIEGITHRL